MRAAEVVLVALCGVLVLIAAPMADGAELPPETSVSGARTPRASLAEAPLSETPPAPAPLPEAPFGLRWLMSKQEVKDAGVELKSPLVTEFGESYVVSQLPKDMPDLYYAALSFGHDDHLIRITATGGSFADDFDGHRVTARCGELAQILEKKYGEGKSELHIDKAFEASRFALGLQVKKNWMSTVFTPDRLHIELSAFSMAGARTGWRIVFEYVPGMERLEQHLKKSEEDAL